MTKTVVQVGQMGDGTAVTITLDSLFPPSQAWLDRNNVKVVAA